MPFSPNPVNPQSPYAPMPGWGAGAAGPGWSGSPTPVPAHQFGTATAGRSPLRRPVTTPAPPQRRRGKAKGRRKRAR